MSLDLSALYANHVEGKSSDAAAVLVLCELLQALFGFEHGEIELASGQQQVEIKTDEAVSRVYLAIESGEIPVCNGALDCATAIPNANGFLIVANIVSTQAKIHWLYRRS